MAVLTRVRNVYTHAFAWKLALEGRGKLLHTDRTAWGGGEKLKAKTGRCGKGDGVLRQRGRGRGRGRVTLRERYERESAHV
eukprot:3769046-Rhodomonas_salina.1